MTVDASLLQISVQEQERWRRRMSVTVPASEVKKEEQRAAKALASRAKLKGFRQGRVPARMIESRFGGALRREALDRLIGEAYRVALARQELRPISEGELEEVRYEPEQDLVFSIAFDVQPRVELARLGGFAVERPHVAVTDDHVTRVLGRIREQNGVWNPAEDGAPQDRDLVNVRILKLDEHEGAESKEYEFVLGQGDAIPDIESAIRTLRVGGQGDFDVTFPDDFPDEARRGSVERVRIELLARKSLVLPELDDDLARQVGGFETLGDLEARVREDLGKEAAEQAESAVRGQLLERLIEANPFEIPVSMVDGYIQTVLGENTRIPPEQLDEIRDSLRPEAERTVKRILVIDRIADTQSLRATEDELDERVQKIAEANDSTPAKVYAGLQKSGRLDALEREITERKVFEFLKAQSEIIDAPAA